MAVLICSRGCGSAYGFSGSAEDGVKFKINVNPCFSFSSMVFLKIERPRVHGLGLARGRDEVKPALRDPPIGRRKGPASREVNHHPQFLCWRAVFFSGGLADPFWDIAGLSVCRSCRAWPERFRPLGHNNRVTPVTAAYPRPAILYA
jgi:hypothetical protein